MEELLIYYYGLSVYSVFHIDLKHTLLLNQKIGTCTIYNQELMVKYWKFNPL